MLTNDPQLHVHRETSGRPLAALASLVVDDHANENAKVSPGFTVLRSSVPFVQRSVHLPSLSVVLQGERRVRLEGHTLVQDPKHYLVVTRAILVDTEIVAASSEDPFVALVLGLDPTTVSGLLHDVGHRPVAVDKAPPPAFLCRLDEEFSDALSRLLLVFRDPTERRILGPGVVREVLYRILQGEHGSALAGVAPSRARVRRIRKVIEYVNEHFSERLSIRGIARVAGMSVSALHHGFHDVTGKAPLQFVKSVRLSEARALLVNEGLDVGEAAFRVGYGSPSQFSREFRREFGVCPSTVRGPPSRQDLAG